MRVPRLFCLVAVLTLAFSSATFAGEKRNEPVGKMNVTSSTVEWEIAVDNDRILLNVLPPDGDVFSRDFPAGRNPSYRVLDNPAKSADGTYTYELRVVPRISESVKRQLASARAAGNDAEVARLRSAAGLTNTLVQSGSFTIMNGAVVSPDLPEPGSGAAAPRAIASASRPSADAGVSAATAPVRRIQDVVTADDAIIQGSLCVGLDCVVNEAFGFDTLRLKENNTRVKFDDTSTSTGFAANDWQLTANDSASGGLNKFSIEDITGAKIPLTAEAGAPTNSIYLKSSGKVGFRTNTPALDLHMVTSDTPAVRFEQNNTGGFTAQTWDIGANEANWFVRDLTGGSRLPLRIRPGAATSSVDISANGDVGIGNLPNNGYKLHVQTNGTANPIVWQRNGTGASNVWTLQVDSGGTYIGNLSLGSFPLQILNDGKIGFGTTPTNPIQHSNGAYLSAGGAWINSSSRELKQDICDLDSSEAEAALRDLTPVKYAYRAAPSEHHVGFIAEDVPNLVAATDRKGLSALDIVAVLTKVVQDQQKTIDELSQRLERLESK